MSLLALYDVPETFSFELFGSGETPARTRIRTRSQEWIIDEPISFGGSGLAATPIEHLFSAYLATTNVLTNLIAEKQGIPLSHFEMTTTIDMDARAIGSGGAVSVPLPFRSVESIVTLTGPSSNPDVERLRALLWKHEPIRSLLTAAGVAIAERWQRA